MENGILSTPLDPNEVAYFLRENAGLDKKMIGEYISKKKNVESKILESFVKSFDFSNTTIDKAMRLYLEAFRLPGEAPLIFLVVEHFADHWHVSIIFSNINFEIYLINYYYFFLRNAIMNHLLTQMQHLKLLIQ